MTVVAVTIGLALLAAALFVPARTLARRVLASSRPDTRLAAAVNGVILAAIFAFVLINELGAPGIVAAIPGVVAGGELGLIVSYYMTRLAFGAT